MAFGSHLFSSRVACTQHWFSALLDWNNHLIPIQIPKRKKPKTQNHKPNSLAISSDYNCCKVLFVVGNGKSSTPQKGFRKELTEHRCPNNHITPILHCSFDFKSCASFWFTCNNRWWNNRIFDQIHKKKLELYTTNKWLDKFARRRKMKQEQQEVNPEADHAWEARKE